MHASLSKSIAFFAVLAGASILTLAQAVTPNPDVGRATQLILDGKQDEAVSLLESLSKKGDKEATIMLGAIFGKYGRTSDAIRLLEPLAKAGDSEAQWYLFQAYSLATPPNAKLADRWLKRAAASGNAKAIGVLRHGRDAEPDHDGKVSTRALASSLKSMIGEKAAAFSDKTVSCYGTSRSELTSIFNQSLDDCVRVLPPEQQERVVPSPEFMQNLTSCTNSKLFERTKRTPSEIVACLSKTP